MKIHDEQVNCLCSRKTGCALLTSTLLVIISVPVSIGVHAWLTMGFVSADWWNYAGSVLIRQLTEMTILEMVNETILPLTAPGVGHSLQDYENGLNFIGQASTGYLKALHRPEFKELFVTVTGIKMSLLSIESIRESIYKLIDILDNEKLKLYSRRVDRSGVQNLLQITFTDLADVILGIPQGTFSFLLRIMACSVSLKVLIATILTLLIMSSILSTLILYKALFNHCSACAANLCLIIPVTLSMVIMTLYFTLAASKLTDIEIGVVEFDKGSAVLEESLSLLFNGSTIAHPQYKSTLIASEKYAKLLHSILDTVMNAKNLYEADVWNTILFGSINSWIETFSLEPLVAPAVQALDSFAIYDTAKSLGSLMKHMAFFNSLLNSFITGRNDTNWLINIYTVKDLVGHMIGLVFYKLAIRNNMFE